MSPSRNDLYTLSWRVYGVEASGAGLPTVGRLLTDRVSDLRHAMRGVHTLAPFRIDAWVFISYHIYAVWTLDAA